jgi:hypothetical protein
MDSSTDTKFVQTKAFSWFCPFHLDAIILVSEMFTDTMIMFVNLTLYIDFSKLLIQTKNLDRLTAQMDKIIITSSWLKYHKKGHLRNTGAQNKMCIVSGWGSIMRS